MSGRSTSSSSGVIKPGGTATFSLFGISFSSSLTRAATALWASSSKSFCDSLPGCCPIAPTASGGPKTVATATPIFEVSGMISSIGIGAGPKTAGSGISAARAVPGAGLVGGAPVFRAGELESESDEELDFSDFLAAWDFCELLDFWEVLDLLEAFDFFADEDEEDEEDFDVDFFLVLAPASSSDFAFFSFDESEEEESEEEDESEEAAFLSFIKASGRGPPIGGIGMPGWNICSCPWPM
mmetsp:Transcript_88666/g.185310  ORF Transcript_88666/g.185310 Transcript_88666/m.185310 type:complete len:240 (-) Transcript_88666:940-1659(-)